MAQTQYESFLPEVQPHAGGAPEPVVIHAIRNAAIEFCERSWAYQKLLGPIAITPFVQEYVFAAGSFGQDAATDVAEILWATYNKRIIRPAAKADLNIDSFNWQSPTPQSAITATQAKCGTAPTEFYSDQAQGLIGLVPIPNAAPTTGGLMVYVALKPSRASVDVPLWLYENYAESIAQGALWRLYGQPKKAWTNANLAGTHKALFDEAVAQTRMDSSRSFTRAALRNRRFGVASW